MIKKEIFENKKKSSIEIIIEPMAQNFILQPDQKAIFELTFNEKSLPMTLQIWDDSVVIFEEAGAMLKLYINDVLLYPIN